MSENIFEIRKLEKQFTPKKVTRIRALQTDISSLHFNGGAGRFYALELIYSLEAGLLLASLHLSCSLLELCVRDLLIYISSPKTKQQDFIDTQVNETEEQYEDGNKPMWTFHKMINELSERKIITKKDANKIKKFYERVRIPIHHGLTRRFVRENNDSPVDFLGAIKIGRSNRIHLLDEQMEDISINLIEIAISFLKTITLLFDEPSK
jgi:hypothetical protein